MSDWRDRWAEITVHGNHKLTEDEIILLRHANDEINRLRRERNKARAARDDVRERNRGIRADWQCIVDWLGRERMSLAHDAADAVKKKDASLRAEVERWKERYEDSERRCGDATADSAGYSLDLAFMEIELKRLREQYIRNAPYLEGCDPEAPHLAPDCPVCVELVLAGLSKGEGAGVGDALSEWVLRGHSWACAEDPEPCTCGYDDVVAEFNTLRAAAWPGDGEWTRKPAEAKGYYLIGWREHGPGVVGRDLAVLTAGEGPSREGDFRWSIPAPLEVMPPVPEES